MPYYRIDWSDGRYSLGPEVPDADGPAALSRGECEYVPAAFVEAYGKYLCVDAVFQEYFRMKSNESSVQRQTYVASPLQPSEREEMLRTIQKLEYAAREFENRAAFAEQRLAETQHELFELEALT